MRAWPSLAVLVIDENRIRASIIEAGLREAGHQRVTVLHDVTGIARRIAEIEDTGGQAGWIKRRY